MMNAAAEMTMTKTRRTPGADRTDVHAPSRINPADYRYERMVYLYPSQDEIMFMAQCPGAFEGFKAEQKEALDFYAAQGWQGGNFAAKKTCDHCGARFRYGMMYRHEPSNEVICVGYICAEATMEVDSRAELEYSRLVARVAHVREMAKTKASVAKRKADFFTLYPEMVEAIKTNHRIVRDIAERFDSYGSLTEKQMALVAKLHAEASNPTAKASEPTWVAVTEGRRDLVGVVLARKTQESMYGVQHKMLLRVDGADGTAEKVWMTIPSSLLLINRADGTQNRLERGERISVTATVERSRDDATFGIGKRPTGGALLA